MSRASDVRSLTQDIAQAHDDRAQEQVERTRRIAEIEKETARLLNRFDREHQAMGRRLRADLAKVKPEVRLEVSSLVDAFYKRHQAMSQALRAELAKVKPEVRSEVSSLLDGFDNAHQAMSQALRAELAKVKPGVKSEVSSLLDGFDKAHQAMSQALRAELAKVKSEVSGLLDRFSAEVKERAEEVISIRSEARNLVESFRKDSAEAAAAWRDLVATMQAKRGMPAAPRPAKPRVAEAVEEAVIPQEKGGLQNRILDLIMEHAEGIKLIEMTEATGEARVKLGNITRMLLDEGKIRKEGLLYFPAR